MADRIALEDCPYSIGENKAKCLGNKYIPCPGKIEGLDQASISRCPNWIIAFSVVTNESNDKTVVMVEEEEGWAVFYHKQKIYSELTEEDAIEKAREIVSEE